ANAGTVDFTPPGANQDGDGDWVLVLETDPPVPVLTGVKRAADPCVYGFATVAGLAYDLQRAGDVRAGPWSDVVTGIPGTGGRVEVPDPGCAASGNGVYRVSVRP